MPFIAELSRSEHGTTPRTAAPQPGTTQSSPPRRALRGLTAAVAASTLAFGALVLGAGTASAKSGIAVTVSTHALRLGQSVHVTGTGGDDGMRLTYLCIDQKTAWSGWRTIACNWRPFQTVAVDVRATGRGSEQFRARLLGRHYVGGPLVQDRISSPTAVLVH
ncbi:hypothetical protein ABIA33_003476 [Streptacidiphilus sp. MAP12-16]|uniref:hypothetical protein n=1 Tax=Streptacidiphilus sp. MAP12-16 TaxID=3156300 RepID=UPI003517D432